MKYTTKNPFVLLKYLKENNIPYEIKKTLFTMEIKSQFGVFKWISNESTVPKDELYFISMLKKSIEKIDCRKYGEINSKDILYFKLPNESFEINNCYEIDISSAYWFFAKDFLPPEIYEKGTKVSKQTRLTALGALAKTVSKMNFNGSEFEYLGNETADTKSLFFYCAKKTSELISEMFEICNRPLFFWVDAVFTSDEKDLKYINYVLEKHGLTGRQYFCEKIISSENTISVYSKQHKEEKKAEKEFRVFFKQRKNSSYFINKILNEKKTK